MATFKIAPNPTFKAKVDIPRAGGAVVAIEIEFKYRGRKELAALFDGWNKRSSETQARLKALGDEVSISDLTDADIERQVEQVADVVVGWEFEDEVSDESIRALVETSAGAPAAIVDAYQKAFEVARRGN